jgi:hypothetical protein
MTRTTDGGSTTFLAGGTQAFPAWLKLVRSGATISAYSSADGSTWTSIGSTATSISASTSAGLVVTSHTTGVTDTSSFDNVSVTAGSTPPPPPPPPVSDVVVYASDIPSGNLHGEWVTAADSTSPNGVKLSTPNNGVKNTTNPLAAPVHYVDVPFTATGGTQYTLWLRIKALNNSKDSDSIYVQFSDALINGAAAYPIGTTSGLIVNLATDATASSDMNWGWVDGAYWLGQTATVTFPSTGAHTLRIQVREDGVQVDQIVLSPSRYFNSAASCPTSCGGAPGPVSNDTTIVTKQ